MREVKHVLAVIAEAMVVTQIQEEILARDVLIVARRNVENAEEQGKLLLVLHVGVAAKSSIQGLTRHIEG